MSSLIITVNDESAVFDIGNKTKVYIFENIKPYHDEICDIIEENKLSYQELKSLVESWGGSIELVSLSSLIKNYKKNIQEGLPI